MKMFTFTSRFTVFAFTAMLLSAFAVDSVLAKINGIEGNNFSLTARTDYISTADGGVMQIWGLADDGGSNRRRAQYPAPTLILKQGETITIQLNNRLTVAPDSSGQLNVPNISLVFPGHKVNATGGSQGQLTQEALPNGSVTYTFTAGMPGTYNYHSGTNPGLQIEMGITGAIIVRPEGFDPINPTAYGHPDTAYDYEELFFLTEMDPNIHQLVEYYGPEDERIQPLLDHYFSNYWLINGRTAPDDLAAAGVRWLPTQPYNSAPRMHPGDILLMRVVGGGRDMHPFHHHGNHATVIARDGRMLESFPGAGPDLATEGFTITGTPGKTVDALFHWTGEGLNWDIYGGTDVVDGDDPNSPMYHTCNGKSVNQAQDPGAPKYDPVTHEYCADHGKPFPVTLPGNQELAFGGWWGGSPYLGALGALPPGEGGLNPNGGFSFMWHSHTEKELTNWDIFPGGMMTMMIIEPPGVVIEK